MSVLFLALEVVDLETKILGLLVNWIKAKIHTTDASLLSGSLVLETVSKLSSRSPTSI